MHESLFILLRLGLKITTIKQESVERFCSFTSKEWSELMHLAERHGVLAFTFDGLQRLPKTSLPEMGILMAWLGQTSYLEERNKQQIDVMKKMCDHWIKSGCSTMLMKGQANGLYYPNSMPQANW